MIKSRSYFSLNLIVSAARLAVDAKSIEDGAVGQDWQYYTTRTVQHRGAVISAIISAASFLEAFINELCADMDDVNLEYAKAVLPSVRETMAGLWNLGIPRTAGYPIVEKYAIVYFIVKNARLDISQGPSQNVGLLTTLRNDLVHYEPSWIDHSRGQMKNAHHLEKRFRSIKIPLNTLTGGQKPFYPDQLLGYGCAKWAVDTAVTFIDVFCKEIGITPYHESVRHLLSC